MPKAKKHKPSNTEASSPCTAYDLHDVAEWLAKRKLEIPVALSEACPKALASTRQPQAAADQSAEFQWALRVLPALREREKRALARYVQHRGATGGSSGPCAGASSTAIADSWCSSDDESDAAAITTAVPTVRGGSWPADVVYSNDYLWDADVPAELQRRYRPEGTRKRAARPGTRTFSAVVTEAHHPARGQFGLFAAHNLACGAWVIDYVGAVALGENEDKKSDYVCDFGEQSELALDAKSVGNEGRFVNDYRNTGHLPNVEFRLRRDRRGELRQGIFVCSKQGVRQGEELLISYGKSYWRPRIDGSMEDFIYRLPGEGPKLPSSEEARSRS